MKAEIPDDIGRLVGLVGGPAWALYAFYVGTITAIAIAGTPNPAEPERTALALVLTAAAGALLVSESRTPIPGWRILCVYAVIVGDVALCSPHLATSGPIGFEAWYLGASNFLLFAIALRGRIIAAWIGGVDPGGRASDLERTRDRFDRVRNRDRLRPADQPPGRDRLLVRSPSRRRPHRRVPGGARTAGGRASLRTRTARAPRPPPPDPP